MPPTVRPGTKLRTLVNTVNFVSALSHKKGRSSNGVHNAGIHKATRTASSSSTGSPSRPVPVTRSILEKEPDAASAIPSSWGAVDSLQYHFVAVSGVKYLVHCEAKTDWLTEGALMQRKDGLAALAVYREVSPLHFLDAHLANSAGFLDAFGLLRYRATGCMQHTANTKSEQPRANTRT
jgi:hypothetical protein